jgi:serine/threonine protein kinase
MSATSRLIHQKEVSAHQRVCVWQESRPQGQITDILYRKAWQSDVPQQAEAWLSWAKHEHVLLSLLAEGGAHHAVAVSDLHVDSQAIELVTRDAGPELQRDWLNQQPGLFQSDRSLLELTQACLVALHEIHQLGIVHGDLKADNICIPRQAQGNSPDWSGLRLIDFAFSLSRSKPLRFVLPTDPDRIDYLPEFYKSAIRKAQSQNRPEWIQKACCAQIDVFSLGVMLDKFMQTQSAQVSSVWPVTSRLVHTFKAKGAQAPSAFKRWLSEDLSLLSEDMLELVRSEIEQLGRTGRDAAARIEPMAAPLNELLHTPVSTPMSTPLSTPLATPLTTPPATPLATPLSTALPTPLSTPLATALSAPSTASPATPMATPLASQALVTHRVSALAQIDPASGTAPAQVRLPSRTASAPWRLLSDHAQRWVWLALSLMLIYVFTRIDQAFVRDGLLISDSDYAWGLLGMALAPLHIVGAAKSLNQPSRLTHLLMLGVSAVLFLVGFHFLSSLSALNVSWADWLF